MHSLSIRSARSANCQPAKPTLIRRITTAFALARSRKQLGNLDAHQLSDLGISASAAKKEANRPIWDVPAHWTK